MATNLALNDALIAEAQRLGGHKTKKEAVTVALEEYVRQKKLKAFFDLWGTVDYDPDYDYKAIRRQETAKRVPKWE